MTQQADRSMDWTPGQRVAFRFVTLFFVGYTLPFPFDKVPGLHVLAQAYARAWHRIAAWVGEHVLRLGEPITQFQVGSGDKTYNYVFLLIIGVLALAGSALWSFLDRRRSAYATGLHWLRVLVRYYLGSFLVFYGLIKVFHLQMQAPTLFELVQPFGDKNPMGLAWSYVGLSSAYSAFVGFAEVIAGILLFFRQTTTLGALGAAVIMLNVAVMNFTFLIPVKLFSSMLFIMAVFLTLPDVDRLARVLLFNKPTQPRLMPSYFHGRWQRNAASVIKSLFIVSVVLGTAVNCFQQVRHYGSKRERSPLYGIYDVTTFVRNGDTLAPLTTDPLRWRQLITDAPDHAHVRMMGDSMAYHSTVWNPDKQILSFASAAVRQRAELTYEVDSVNLRLRGTLGYDSVQIELRRRDLSTFHLINTPFEWIQE